MILFIFVSISNSFAVGLKKNPSLVYTGTNLLCISNTNRIKLFSFLFFERRKIELETMTIGSVDRQKDAGQQKE